MTETALSSTAVAVPHSPSKATRVPTWIDTSLCDAQQAEFLGGVLETRGRQPRQVAMRETLFKEIGFSAGMNVLELGCGTGVVARQLAQIVGPTGSVVAVDSFELILDYARKIGTVEGDAPIEYVAGDAESYPKSGFDAVLAMTLLGCVDNVGSVIANMRDRTRPGGLVVVFDQDYETLIFDHSDVELSRKIVTFGARHNIRNPTVGRTLAAEMVRCGGIRNVKCWGWVYAERDAGSYMITLAERYAALAIEHDVVPKPVADTWLAEIRERGRTGTFFASINYYCTWGER